MDWFCYWTKLGSAHPWAVKLIYWHRVVVKESAVFTAGQQARSPGYLVPKKPKLPDGLQQSIFKDKVREWSPRVCDQLVHNSLIGW